MKWGWQLEQSRDGRTLGERARAVADQVDHRMAALDIACRVYPASCRR